MRMQKIRRRGVQGETEESATTEQGSSNTGLPQSSPPSPQRHGIKITQMKSHLLWSKNTHQGASL